MKKENSSTYEGWNALSLENRWLKLYILPNLGGRIIQAEMDGHEFLYVNPFLAGKEPGPGRLGPDGNWLNFGGEKIWPAPQGWDSPDEWPGPPDPVLDGGIYSCSWVPGSQNEEELLLVSPNDPYTGMQLTRRISLSDKCSEAFIHATFTNKSDRPRSWSIWPVCQVDTSGEAFPGQFRMFCPLNPESKFPGGYKIMHGLVNNPQVGTLNGNLVIDYRYIVGKTGLDTMADWIAFVNRKVGKVFIMKFRNEGEQIYPDGTNVQIWTTGRGIIYSRNKIREFANDKSANHPYMEMELLSPVREMKPGESSTFEYSLLVSSIPPGCNLLRVNPRGIVSEPLSAATAPDAIRITGKYGVFMDGIIKLNISKSTGNEIIHLPGLSQWKASPLKGVEIEIIIPGKKLAGFDGRITADLYDQNGHFAGELDQLVLKV